MKYTEQQIRDLKLEITRGREAIHSGDPCPVCKEPWIDASEVYGPDAVHKVLMHGEGCPLDPANLEECPFHGEVPIDPWRRNGSTGGPDPYAVTGLVCGHSVACFGPGEPNVIVRGRA